MLNIHNLSVSFGGTFLFEEVTFRLGAGDRVGLVGKNGAGKSTMLKILAKDFAPDSGNIAAEKEIRRNEKCILQPTKRVALLPSEF